LVEEVVDVGSVFGFVTEEELVVEFANGVAGPVAFPGVVLWFDE
jgi:hypothetical protein